jgi:steroid delta-isomerase-like uncharacterized protein
MSEANKIVIRRLFEAFNTGDLSQIDELVAPNYIYHEPTIGERRGREGVRDVMTTFRAAFPDVKITVDQQIAEGDIVVTRWTSRGTHRGPLFGISPTGRHVTVTGILISRIHNGKVLEEDEVADTLGMMRQLGAIPAMGQAA